MYAILVALRDALALISGVASCKIGLEANMSPVDYPMVRVVPVRVTPGKPYDYRNIETRIFFGANISASEGLELVYSTLITLEEEIIKVVKAQGGRYIETITDEDRIDTYKLMVVRLEIRAARPTVV